MFLRHLFNSGLSHSTLKVYMAAIVANQPSDSPAAALFLHTTLKTFLKGVKNIRPRTHSPAPQWSLRLVLQRLMCPPFEPMGSTSLWLLSLKALFLVAITSARRACELAAYDQPYLQFHPNKVTLFPDVSFIPKVVSDFHLNQPLVSPMLFPSPTTDLERSLHSLDVKRALAFYASRTSAFRKTQRLFVAVHGHLKGSPISSQTVSKWIVKTIKLAYALALCSCSYCSALN